MKTGEELLQDIKMETGSGLEYMVEVVERLGYEGVEHFLEENENVTEMVMKWVENVVDNNEKWVENLEKSV